MADASVLTDSTTTATTDGTTTTATTGDHWSATLGDDLKPWASGMGLDKLDAPAALAKVLPMYRGAEQKLGVPADQVLKLPGEKATPEEIKAFHVKLGVPESPDGYELPVPEGQGAEFAKTAAGWMHEAGIPKAAAAKLAAKWNEHIAGAQEQQGIEWDKRVDTEVTELKGEWGDDYEKNKSLAQRVLNTMGFSLDEQKSIERALGPKGMLQKFSKFGGALGEHRFAGGADGSTQFGMSPEAARARIGELRKDSAWMTAYVAGDADKKAEFTRLNQIGYPDTPQAA